MTGYVGRGRPEAEVLAGDRVIPGRLNPTGRTVVVRGGPDPETLEGAIYQALQNVAEDTLGPLAEDVRDAVDAVAEAVRPFLARAALLGQSQAADDVARLCQQIRDATVSDTVGR